MIVVETTAACPLGLTTVVVLEQLDVPYTILVRDDGYFVERYGAPGPRVVEGADARLGRDGAVLLVERCLDARGASAATRYVHEHMNERLSPAIRRMRSADASVREEGRNTLRAELDVLETLLAIVPRTDVVAGLLVPALVLLERLFSRMPELGAAFPTLAACADEVRASEVLRRARARIASAPHDVATSEDVIAFWFGSEITDEADAFTRMKRWFMGGPSFDREIRARFGATVEAALAGALDDWAGTARGRLALVLVLDQFTRNVFRDDPRAWSGDARALSLATDALDRGLDAELSWIECVFLAMPLLHAEDAGVAPRCVAQAKVRFASAPPVLARIAEGHLEQAEKYQRVLDRFGRFPFRNAVLGRATTPEEAAFLAEFTGPPRIAREMLASGGR